MGPYWTDFGFSLLHGWRKGKQARAVLTASPSGAIWALWHGCPPQAAGLGLQPLQGLEQGWHWGAPSLAASGANSPLSLTVQWIFSWLLQWDTLGPKAPLLGSFCTISLGNVPCCHFLACQPASCLELAHKHGPVEGCYKEWQGVSCISSLAGAWSPTEPRAPVPLWDAGEPQCSHQLVLHPQGSRLQAGYAASNYWLLFPCMAGQGTLIKNMKPTVCITFTMLNKFWK